jgi:Hydrazine synthase alpha subunit middle domain/WD40-like Beta Propeller Repeat
MFKLWTYLPILFLVVAPSLGQQTNLLFSLEQIDSLKKDQYGSFDEIVFASRSLADDGHWYANISYYSAPYKKSSFGQNGRLCAWNIKTGELRCLLEDLAGAVRDPCVSYDAKKILFSYRKENEGNYHLYEINADGKNLRQLTQGGYDDIEPAYLPDGGIIFVSTRSRRWVNCWLTQVATIHRCEADGKNIRPLSANIEHDNTPWPLPDGRILYMRWEYVDRSQVNYHHLWTMNPDGTQHSIFFGNMHPGGLYIDAKPIPGCDDVLFIDSPGHGSKEHQGFVARVSQKEGPDKQENLRRLTKKSDFRDPWPFSSDLFMAAQGRNLILLNNNGAMTNLFSLPKNMSNCLLHEPRPLMPRKKEIVIAEKTDWTQAHGVFFLENIYEGRHLKGVEKGSIKKLIVLESLPKPINFTGGMDPLSYVGTFTLPRVLGTVPVEPDGSAYFEVPALRALFFVALDGQGRAVKRMQSFTQLMPGEQQGCTGCHENRTQAPRPYNTKSLALRKKPATIDEKDRIFDVPDFPKHIQPILDRNCVRCHNPTDRKGGVDLCGDRGPMFSISYHALVVHQQIADGRNYARSNYALPARAGHDRPVARCERALSRHLRGARLRFHRRLY